MTQPLALVVDDEPDIRELLEITLARMGVGCRAVGTVGDAMGELGCQRFNLCLVDMRLPDGSGTDIVRAVANDHPDTPVAVITAHGSMATAIEALKAGAFDFVSKPVELPVLRRLVETALRLERPPGPADTDLADRNASAGATGVGQLIGDSDAMQQIRRMILKLARTQAPVFVSGDSGTGKELAARAIHAHGPRAERPFVAVNCGAIPQELMESEFFGHVKGSFTGAVRDKPGLFQGADGGTLFLDEVAELPLSMQVKLLRVIQEKSVRPVGGGAEAPVDVRIISASHKDLPAMVEHGDFRKDLFYRIHVIELRMAPLRERPDDIPQLVGRILERLARRTESPAPTLEPAALAVLQRHHFPGNVRELENILERAMALCEGERITVQDLGLGQAPAGDTTAAPADLAQVMTQGLEDYLEDVERDVIRQALEQTRWNRTAAARALGISFRALRYRLEKLGLDGEGPDGPAPDGTDTG
jgi:two-component system response regulator PilR (NtrC family)